MEGNLTELRNLLRSRLRGWEQLLPIYMPGLLQYQADMASSRTPPSTDNPEDVEIWLPSRIPDATQRLGICRDGLPAIEERIRTAQCHDALEGIRHTLKIKSRMIFFKNKNVRGQRDGTRSRSVIDRIHERARTLAAKYRASRVAKRALSGPGEWENELQVLEDCDVRGYQDPNQLRVRKGRRGTLDDEQVADVEADSPKDIDDEERDIRLINEERERRDGTGETRRTISWIWMSRTPNTGNEGDDIL